MVVAPHLVGGATVLVFHEDDSEGSTQRIVDTLKKLNAKSVALVESSFSEKQIQPLTKRLIKANLTVSSFAKEAE